VEDWDRKAEWMRLKGAVHAKWLSDELVELELGPDPSEAPDLDRIDAEQERREETRLQQRRAMMLAAVPGVRGGKET